MTITEALADCKVIDARIEKKRAFITANLVRDEMLRDPLEKDGGSLVTVARERQSINDLFERKVALRRAIQQANEQTTVTVGTMTRTIAEWLVWKRDVAPVQQVFLQTLWNTIQSARQQATRQGKTLSENATGNASNVVVNLNESKLGAEIEDLATVLGQLDGQLSLKNATVMVSV